MSAHGYRYPFAGACDLLIEDLMRESHGYEWERTQEEAKHDASVALLEDAVQLFNGYGYKAKRQEDDLGVFCMFMLAPGKWLGLRVQLDGGVNAWISLNRRERSVPFKVPLAWDPTSRKWLGPRLGERDVSQVGHPHLRVSALEALTESILDVRRAVLNPENQ